MPSSVLKVVSELKEALLKEIPAKDDASVERCKDILERLSEVDMDLAILTQTLIGATVNKLKKHEKLGQTAKRLVKGWKKKVENTTAEVSKPQKVKEENAERRESMNDSEYDPKTEWMGLTSNRASMCEKFYSIFVSAKPALLKQGVNQAAIPALTGPRAAEMEGAIFEGFARDKKAYMDKSRSICFNLKKNQPLTVSILLGQVEPKEVVKMSAEELASDEIKQKREETAKKLIDSKRLDWDQANEDKINNMCGIKGDLLSASLFTCGRCKSTKTTSTQKQTRSADEPMTVFVLCLNCGKRWKC